MVHYTVLKRDGAHGFILCRHSHVYTLCLLKTVRKLSGI